MTRYYSITGHYAHGFRSVYLEALTEADALKRGKSKLRRDYPGLRFSSYIVRDES